MFQGFYPQYDLSMRIQHTKLDCGVTGMPSARMERMEKPETEDFKTVFSGLVENLNEQMNEPDVLLKDSLAGNQNVDIHDVMTAMAKAELGINVATQVTGKVIQAYDRIMQLQV
ncbi:flagellar hook-basal body complex protein FliE [bacterium]|nr:flagellar hook-basal body complex protein FliE [bacterium]